MLQWTDDLEVGLTSHDARHRDLLREAYGLVAALGEPGDHALLPDQMGRFCDRLDRHLEDERALLEGAASPALARLVAAHETFVTAYRTLAVRLALEGPEPHLAVQLSRLLCGWLQEHVSTPERARPPSRDPAARRGYPTTGSPLPRGLPPPGFVRGSGFRGRTSSRATTRPTTS